jgi:hypothetical protein
MTKGITKNTLQVQLDELNSNLYDFYHLSLDYSERDGGYCLIHNNNKGHVTSRMSGKELHQYLNGALDWNAGDR